MGRRPLPRDFAPLADRYAAARRTLPAAEVVPGEKLPQPYRRLLVHHGDMTSTLENFHRASIHVRAISSVREKSFYRRKVVLEIDGTSRPVEFGAISIHLDALPAAARKLVLAAKRPFGAILHDCRVDYISRPTAYFKLRSDATIARALKLSRPQTLYGRCNRMRDGRGRIIAEIVEILAP